jgi:hypothetical protein
MAYSTISKPSLYFNTKLYTGNGGTNAVTGVGFQPDLIWIKERSSTSSHNLVDAVRGVTKRISSDNTGAEETLSGIVSSFDSDGFTNGADNGVNENSQTYVAWNWKANGQGSSNTDGSINTTYTSVNTTAGFSISKYTGTGYNATVGHGLNSAPGLIIVKNLTTSGRNWQIFHHKNTASPATQQLEFGTDATATVTTQWNSVMPTSSVFSIGTNDSINKSGDGFIAYCFAEKKGYSKFGSYSGNDNADGTFVYLGFKPAFVIIKEALASRDWIMMDNKRDTDNVVSNRLFPNGNSAQNTNNDMLDFLSNGFKIRNTNSTANNNGTNNYIYMAFAEEPLVANVGASIPATAR